MKWPCLGRGDCGEYLEVETEPASVPKDQHCSRRYMTGTTDLLAGEFVWPSSWRWSGMLITPSMALYFVSYTSRDRTVSLIAPSYLEPVSCHTRLVCLYRRLAVFGRIRRLGEEHALVALRLFVLADTAWLPPKELSVCCALVLWLEWRSMRRGRTLGFSAAGADALCVGRGQLSVVEGVAIAAVKATGAISRSHNRKRVLRVAYTYSQS